MSEPNRYFINNLPDYNGKISFDSDQHKSRTVEIVAHVLAKFKNEPSNADGGLYVGIGGVSYMLYHLAKLPSFSSTRDQWLSIALDYLKHPVHDINRILAKGHITERTGFLTGAVGIYALGAVLYDKLGQESDSQKCIQLFKQTAELLLPINWYSQGGDELFVGRAGFLCAFLWLRRELGKDVVEKEIIFKMLDAIIESGRSIAKTTKSVIPLMYHYYGTLYIGPAHGLSGILFILLSFSDWLESRPEAAQYIQQSLDGMLSIQQSDGNFPSAMDEIGSRRPPDEELVHWCHGAPGVIYMLAKAYKVFKDEKYLNSALRCGEITWQKGLLKKGPGICHGLGGSGYVFLVLYQLTKNELHLHRALSFMEFYYSPKFKKARTPDSPYSLYEGTSGLACFAGDLLHPETGEFPFFGLE